MARKSPTELYHAALRMYCHGHTPEQIADELAIHRESLQRWLRAPVYPALREATRDATPAQAHEHNTRRRMFPMPFAT